MTHTATIQGQEFWWTATLPDQIHLSQSGATGTTTGITTDADPNALFYLDAKGAPPNTGPLKIDIHYTPEALFGEAHGILSIHVAEPADQEFFGTPAHYADTGNGLRGSIAITFHNDLGVPLHMPASGLADGGGTLALFLNGTTDNTAPTTTFHTPYVHFHAIGSLEQDFPNFAVHGQVGPVVSGGGVQGNPSAAPDWISLAGDIPAGGSVEWGPLTLHARDLSPGPDDFNFSLTLLNGALTDQEIKHLSDDYTAAHTSDLHVMG
jgi:hypothetical protein